MGRRLRTAASATAPGCWPRGASARRRWSTPGPARSAASSPSSKRPRSWGRSCPPWATATSKLPTWRRPSRRCPATSSSWPAPSTCGACCASPSRPYAPATKSRNAAGRSSRRPQPGVTHGNGPQVGLLALESEALRQAQDRAYRDVPPYGLDVLGAESQGMIGFLLGQGLRHALDGTAVATLLTTVLVDTADPAFAKPSKPVGPLYDEATARQLAEARGWSIARDGAGFRRVVPSPRPRGVLEVAAIRAPGQ